MRFLTLIGTQMHSSDRLLGRLTEIGRLCGGKDRFKAFMSSDQFYEIPFLSIRAKLMAADIVYAGSQTPEPSLLEDFDIAATIVPFANFFATENYLPELIKKTKVGNDLVAVCSQYDRGMTFSICYPHCSKCGESIHSST